MFTAMHITADANANTAFGLMHNVTNNQENDYLEAVYITAGVFAHADLKAVDSGSNNTLNVLTVE